MIALEKEIKIANNIVDTIGNTPLVKLNRLFNNSTYNVYGKLELSNPSGSVKDRTSMFILLEALNNGKIQPGHTIIESSSGNMALGLAQACLYFNLKLIVVVDPHINRHTEKLLLTYGAKIEYVQTPNEKGGYLAARLEKVQQLLKQIPNSYWSNQYGNPNNPLAHQNTITEILNSLNGKVDYLFMAVSTCGTIMGCADYISENNIETKIIAVDAKGSVLFGGLPEKRIIPGHGASVRSQFLDTSKLWDHMEVSDLDCVRGCWSLLKEEGILCGGSTGGVISAIKKYEAHIPDNSNCVLLLSDRGDRYLDTIYNKDWLATKIEGVKNVLYPIGGW
ncbi:2,3-diaminopropionate biosynthesis protein SbnA [Arenibacter certesii]|uniref:N-(2-amino-2-carboxyethyl)-L-glutamate synthase n=1 Tax=Arenibacter certesii TaxID=228955 RepID=A0A918MQS6_9FLAO|nr:2,3-diaminopropionate biosynthesis protein SbnA [Arenibacter certesii]GGW45393.1 2,3-diaminopropionate biosynthesis protein SbnA [Arenibacter certesii]